MTVYIWTLVSGDAPCEIRNLSEWGQTRAKESNFENFKSKAKTTKTYRRIKADYHFCGGQVGASVPKEVSVTLFNITTEWMQERKIKKN